MIKPLIPFLFSFISIQVYSQDKPTVENIVTDRPDLTESSITVPHKSIQVETGFLMIVDNLGNTESFKTITYQYPTTLVRFGLFKNIEFRLINQFVNARATNPTIPIEDRKSFGIDNLALGTKINITTEKGFRPEIALLSHVVLPTGSNQFKNDKILFNLIFSLSHTLSDKLSLGYNLGWTTDNLNPNGTGVYTLALGYGITPKLGFFVEAYGYAENLEYATLGLDGGFAYLLNNSIQLDASGGKNITESSYFISAGVSILFLKVFKG